MTIEKQKDVEIEIIDDVDWGAVNVTKQHFIGPKRYIRASRQMVMKQPENRALTLPTSNKIHSMISRSFLQHQSPW
jgi:hypothetical protein